MPNRYTAAAALISLVAILAGVLGDGRVDLADLKTLGAVGMIGTVVWYLQSRQRRDDEAVYDAGHRAGYDAGFLDGRRTARPVVVPLRIASND